MKKAHSADNHVFAEDSIEGFQVLTIFLGINFNLGEPGPPLWFETAVFRRSTDGNPGVRINCDAFRYSTAADAFAGHLAVCQKVRTGEIGE